LNGQVRPVHFEDFSGKDFERLVFAYVLRSRWPDAEWLGETGGDHGRDVWCPGRRKTTAFMCANFKTLTLAKVISDLNRLANLEKRPAEIFVVCGGRVSAQLRVKVKEAAIKCGFNRITVWSGSELEERIRITAPDLLSRFCCGEEFPDTLEGLRVFAESPATAKMAPVRLGAAATRLLIAMADAEVGGLMSFYSLKGYGIIVGGEVFLPKTKDRAIQIKWERAIFDLSISKLIGAGRISGGDRVLTNAGWEAADAARQRILHVVQTHVRYSAV
jgi:hypothetical protein